MYNHMFSHLAPTKSVIMRSVYRIELYYFQHILNITYCMMKLNYKHNILQYFKFYKSTISGTDFVCLEFDQHSPQMTLRND